MLEIGDKITLTEKGVKYQVSYIGRGAFASAFLHRPTDTVFLACRAEGSEQRFRLMKLLRRLKKNPHLPRLERAYEIEPVDIERWPVPETKWWRMPYYKPVTSRKAKEYAARILATNGYGIPSQLPCSLRQALKGIRALIKYHSYCDDFHINNLSEDARGRLILRDPFC